VPSRRAASSEAVFALAGLFLGLVSLYAFVVPISFLMLARTVEDKP
jgi:hypothetical protein